MPPQTPSHVAPYTATYLETASRRALYWLGTFLLIGLALTILYSDAEQQDSGYHFLFARWAWQHPRYLIGVWERPLFTLLYSLPAQFGYPATKFFTVLVSLATAWQTFRLAQKLRLSRAELVVPLLFLQPAFFALCSVVLTETLFALVFVIALRLHLAGWQKTGALVASLLILIRPEGFFLGVLWAIWLLVSAEDWQRNAAKSDKQPISASFGRALATRLRVVIRQPNWLLLATGMVLWWLAALLMTGDPLWIIHAWPPDWQVDGKANGTGPLWWYAALLPLIVGPWFLVPFVVGLWHSLKRRELLAAASAFLTLFVLHSLMFSRGWFGSAGYARYFVCVSPAMALLTLYGWNRLTELRVSLFKPDNLMATSVALALSLLFCVAYVDLTRFTRDARAVETMYEWLRNNPQPVARLISSQVYPRILLDRDPWEKPSFGSDPDYNRKLLEQSPSQTLVLWDAETGPKWYRLQAEDFVNAGFSLLNTQEFHLKGTFLPLSWKHLGGPRQQRMHWLYKK